MFDGVVGGKIHDETMTSDGLTVPSRPPLENNVKRSTYKTTAGNFASVFTQTLFFFSFSFAPRQFTSRRSTYLIYNLVWFH
jgi:hypothetical protein